MGMFSTAVSGMQAYKGMMDVSARNIANARTPGYKKEVAETRERPEGGVELEIRRDESPGPPLVEDTYSDRRVEEEARTEAYQERKNEEPSVREGSNVDLPEEIVNMRVAQRGFEAMTAVYQAQDEMLGTLVDTFA